MYLLKWPYFRGYGDENIWSKYLYRYNKMYGNNLTKVGYKSILNLEYFHHCVFTHFACFIAWFGLNAKEYFLTQF